MPEVFTKKVLEKYLLHNTIGVNLVEAFHSDDLEEEKFSYAVLTATLFRSAKRLMVGEYHNM